jgi:GntR family transcriptional regulator / MocR family aminotransferase
MGAVDVHVSLGGREDLSGEIYRQLRTAIVAGRLQPGDALPPTRELARGLSVSRTTVTEAYGRLWGEGLITSRRGAGTFVSESASMAQRWSRRTLPRGALKPRPVWDSIPLPPPPEMVASFDFGVGKPDASLFPFATWRKLLSEQMRAEVAGRVAYGSPAGHDGLREAISRHIAISRGVKVLPEQVVITNGTQQALDLIARVLLGPADCVAIEDPGYRPAQRVFEALGARVHGVPVDREGLVVEALPRQARLVYVTPSHQYPLGVAMSLQRRLALLAWAEAHNAAIIEDDYDSEFRYSGRPFEPLQTLDGHGRVLYVGSFSKTLLPGLRLGFIVAPPSLCHALHAAKYVTDWHTSLPLQAALAAFIDEGGFGRHLRRMRGVYQTRHERITCILRTEFNGVLDVISSAAGLHVTTLACGASRDAIDSVIARAAARGVACQAVPRHEGPTRSRPGIMLGFGAIAADRIDEGMHRLRRCFDFQ